MRPGPTSEYLQGARDVLAAAADLLRQEAAEYEAQFGIHSAGGRAAATYAAAAQLIAGMSPRLPVHIEKENTMDKTEIPTSTIDAEKILAGPGCCKCTARIADLKQAVAAAATMAETAMAAAEAAQSTAHGADHKAQVGHALAQQTVERLWGLASASLITAESLTNG